jgi:uncharacterized membrane protein
MTIIRRLDLNLYANKLRTAGFEAQVETLIELAQESQPKDIVTVEASNARLALSEAKFAEHFKDLYKQLWLIGIGIVTLTVTLTKLIP